jgi:hypothetical protein
MAVTFHRKITFRPGSVFCFGTISSVADEEGTLHRIADPPRKKSPPTNSENIEVRKEKAQPPVLRKKIAFSKPRVEGPLTRRTPLSTSPTKEWTQITRKKETNRTGRKQVVLSVPPPSKENGKKIATTAAPFYPDVLFIGRVESPPVSDDEPTAPEKNHLSGNPTDRGTNVEIFGDITRPESGTRSSLSRETRSQK